MTYPRSALISSSIKWEEVLHRAVVRFQLLYVKPVEQCQAHSKCLVVIIFIIVLISPFAGFLLSGYMEVIISMHKLQIIFMFTFFKNTPGLK